MRLNPSLLAVPLLCVFCSVDHPAATAPPDTHPFTVRDMLALDRISSPVASPDGRWIVFARRKTDLDADRGRTDLWIVKSDGTGLRQLTTNAANDGSPQWLATGEGSSATVAFLSNRDGATAKGTTQVWAIDVEGGEARRVTDLPVDVDTLRVSEDGKLLAVGAETYPDCADLACTAARDKEKAQKKSTGMIFDKLPIREWDTWYTGKRRHVFVVPVAGGPAVDILKGIDADCPTRPWGDENDYALSPDGKQLALSFKKPMGSQEAWSTNEDIWLAPTDGSAPASDLSAENQARDSDPVFSPDGKSIAWLAMKRPGYESDRYRVVVRDRAGGALRTLTEDWDRSPGSLAWSRAGDRLFATADDLGHHGVFSIDPRSGRVTTLTSAGHAGAVMETSRGLVVLLDSLTSPADLWSVPAGGGAPRRLTDINADVMDHVRLGAPEPFTFQGAKGDTVHAWSVKPIDFDAGKKYPLAFLVHGGPQGSFGDGWSYRWNAQTYAAAGYAVVMVDFHGSTGYGQAFTDAINGDWGGAPYEDLMMGLDAALQRAPWVDGGRTCALGASYGGWMIDYLAGKTDRFRCLVTHDGILSNPMNYYGTEELWFPEWELGGTPWDHPEGYAKYDPMGLVAHWKTPMLVVHGAKDYRVPDVQGLAVFTALQRKGIPSKLLYFPDENHWVLKPADSILWHETVLAWLDQYIGKTSQAPAGLPVQAPAGAK
ncbi:MAG TPA: S9 family peptidase [Polyangiaceae bacterium]